MGTIVKKESEGIENESLFLDELFEDKCNYINEKTHVGDSNFKVPFKKRKFDLSVFTFNEPVNDISHENIIQEPPIDLTFEISLKNSCVWMNQLGILLLITHLQRKVLI